MRSAICLLLLVVAGPIAAQCSWGGLGAGVSGRVQALTSFDDGSGWALWVGGQFTSAGGQPAANLARWDGTQWTGFGSGLLSLGAVTAFEHFATASQPQVRLFAGGAFPGGVASWDGSAWQVAGRGLGGGFPGTLVNDMKAYDDGSGPNLFVAGAFQSAGGIGSPLIAKWDGVTWQGVGGGLGTGFILDSARSLAVFDDGTGPALYVGGAFASAGGQPISYLARWNGMSWSPVGGGLSGGGVSALAVLDAGNGPSLYAVGSFTGAGGAPASGAARWDGTYWTPLPAPIYGSVFDLEVFDDGWGPVIYAGRSNINFGAALPAVLKWDGAAWSVAAYGTAAGLIATFGVTVLGVHDLGNGPRLYGGGEFNSLGSAPAEQIAALTCPAGITLGMSQPGGPGTPVHLINSNLTPGRTYFNIVSQFPCAGGPGSGPQTQLGLCTPRLPYFFRQLALPGGVDPYHVVAPASHVSWGPYIVDPMTLDVVCFDATGGVLGSASPVTRFVIH